MRDCLGIPGSAGLGSDADATKRQVDTNQGPPPSGGLCSTLVAVSARTSS